MNKKYISMFISIFLVLVILLSLLIPIESSVVEASSGINVVQGLLDLQHKVMQEDGPVELNGEWEFYWEELLTPIEFKNQPKSHPFLATVPDTWHNYTYNGEYLPKYGYATYRLNILLDEQGIGRLYSLYVPSIATAYRLWVNDELLLFNGQVGKNQEEMIPQNYAKMATFRADTPQIEILVQVSNFHQRKAGLWEPITLGTVEQITQLRERNILFQGFIIGYIFIVGFYQIILFFQRPKVVSPLFLSLACFAVVLRRLLVKDTLLIYYFPQIPWEVGVTLDYVSAICALIFFLLYVRQELSQDISKRMTKLFIAIMVVYCLFVLITPPRIFTNSLPFLEMLAVIYILTIVLATCLGIRRKREGALLSFIAILVLLIAVLNEIFYYSDFISTDELVSLCLLFYLFTQSIHLARKFSRSFDQVEQLSRELQELNHSLERKVENRTQALRKANNRLQKIEQARRRLLASVSHELNTPLTFIQGYIKAMMDGVVSRDDSSYLRAVYSDTQMMAQLVQDLQELSRLESGQVSFQFEYVDIREFLAELYEEQKPIIEKRGVNFQYQEDLVNPIEEPIYCLVDPIRMKQVYLNLVMNAQKYTPSGGSIIVKLIVPDSMDGKKLSISFQDSGSGIPEKDLPYIFERFYKVNQPEENKGRRGAGLGLAIVKEIVEYHQGTITVSSQQGKGSKFSILLPIARFHSREEEGSG